MEDRELEGLVSYYKALYEKEEKRSSELTQELVKAEEIIADLTIKVDKVKNSRLYGMIRPFRNLYARIKDALKRIRRYGNPKNFIRKVKSKLVERKAYKLHGTESFPDEKEIKLHKKTVFTPEIKFSILVPLFNTPEIFLKEMIESVLAQTYENWELCLADGSDAEHGYVKDMCAAYMAADGEKGRIRYQTIQENLGISGNTNVCFQMATGEYIGLFDHDDVLHPSVLFEYRKRIDQTNADFIYCDEATFQGNSINNMITLHFKPDFAPENLRANNYICHFSVFSAKLSQQTGLFRSEFDGSQDHDMILRLTSAAKNVQHVPKILYYWRSHAASVASDINAKTYAIDAAKGAVAAHLTDHGYQNFTIESTKAFATIFRIRYELLEKPKISIVIPNMDHVEDLRRCIESIIVKSSYGNYEIIIVENNSVKEETFTYYKELEELPLVRIINYRGSFNYSAITNFGVKQAEGKYVILLNNDTEVITRNWMEELLMYAQRSEIGAVGCKLYYEDYTIQHAGIVLGLGAHRTAGHTHYKLAKENLGYMGRLCYAQDVSAVTGACLMIAKEKYTQIKGLDENYAVALNDVDFCLRLREEGYRNIFTPFAELFHYESKSRGEDLESKNKENAKRYQEEAMLFKIKWNSVLEKGDPYYNPNFSLDHSNYTLKGKDKSMVD